MTVIPLPAAPGCQPWCEQHQRDGRLHACRATLTVSRGMHAAPSVPVVVVAALREAEARGGAVDVGELLVELTVAGRAPVHLEAPLARQVAEALLAAASLSEPSPPARTSADDAAAVDAHLGWLAQRGLRPATVYQRRRALTRLAAELPVPLLAAGPAELAAWRDGLDRLSAGVIVTYATHVREFYRWAVRQGLLDVDPAARLVLPKVPRRLPRPISEDQLARAVAAAPQPVRCWLVLAGWAGLRACEIAHLHRDDVRDTADPPTLEITDSKGGRSRVVPMADVVRAELLGLHPAAGWLFPRADGQPGPIPAHKVSQRACRHLHALGIAATLHTLRHRFATRFYAATGDLRATQDVLGHASPITTAGYAAWTSAVAVAGVNAL